MLLSNASSRHDPRAMYPVALDLTGACCPRYIRLELEKEVQCKDFDIEGDDKSDLAIKR